LKLNFDQGHLDDVTLTPDIHTFDTAASISGDIYFRGNVNDIFIIQIVKHLTQATGKKDDLGWRRTSDEHLLAGRGAIDVGAGADM
jgi:hypothetical protein